jgi:hypothetical protein
MSLFLRIILSFTSNFSVSLRITCYASALYVILFKGMKCDLFVDTAYVLADMLVCFSTPIMWSLAICVSWRLLVTCHPTWVDNAVHAIFVAIIERAAVVDRGRWSRRWRWSSLVAACAAHRSKVGAYDEGYAAARICVGGDETSARLFIYVGGSRGVRHAWHRHNFVDRGGRPPLGRRGIAITMV